MIIPIIMAIIFIIYLIKYWGCIDPEDATITLTGSFFIGLMIFMIGGLIASEKADTKKTLVYERELYELKDNTKTYIYKHSSKNVDLYTYLYINKKKDIIKETVECEYTKLHFTKGKPRIVKYKKEIKNPVLAFLFLNGGQKPEYVIYLPEDSIDKTFSVDLE